MISRNVWAAKRQVKKTISNILLDDSLNFLDLFRNRTE